MNAGVFEGVASGGRPVTDTLSANGQSTELSSDGAILLIDDNPAVAGAMEIAFRMAGRMLDTARGPEEALSRLAARRFDAILLDMNFTPGQSNGEEGLALLSRIMADDPAACVVVITAHSGIRIAVAAMQAGARDFAIKPWRNSDLVAKVEAAIARGVPAISSSVIMATDAEPIRLLGESAAMQVLRDLVRRIAPTPAGVTVTGRSGSGRTLTAMAVHAASGQGGGEPARIDLRDESAWARLQDGINTVILRYPDKLGEVAQARLMDRLPPALRCIAIADDLAALTPALRRRIATVEIAVPPLERREGDGVMLARHFARLAAERFGRPVPCLTAAAEEAIRTTVWDDEVRGLALAIERAVLLVEDGTIDAAALAIPVAPLASGLGQASFDLTDAEKAMIKAALREHRHNVTHAAAALGLSRGALYRRMARYGL
ncbi:MAG: Fis family transcriptional regulator [Novosphingobium lindaniclasticum]|jgi:DNA-binding NtrC family response regulator|uniref:sigma-54-dependent transcriptional regulator n=1 Tax=Novosphingobium lindaniclasticum TaxID=1329895 RepID=UPI002409669E|nr:response regulator [Novosphingobium lindaniclasticum]MDF2640675.1 Fis family transcriptional regulator [Novosphingobium lindaniclasticum]